MKASHKQIPGTTFEKDFLPWTGFMKLLQLLFLFIRQPDYLLLFKYVLLPMILFFISIDQNAAAQVRTVGHEFWFSLGGDQSYIYGSQVRLRITAVENTNVEIHYAFNNSTVTYSMVADELKTVGLNIILASNSEAEEIQNHAVHITSTGNISMILLQPNGADDDATVILPADQPAYGTTFYPVSYKVQAGNISPLDFSITCSCDSTVLEITPAMESAAGHPAGIPYQITLNEGQTYECGTTWDILSTPRDLTGWKVQVLNSDCCNPINVYITCPP